MLYKVDDPAPLMGIEADPVVEMDRLIAEGLRAVFQPLYRVGEREPFALEGFTRGPRGHRLESPESLFRTAAGMGRRETLEAAARRRVLQSFMDLHWPGRLSLNVTPACLTQSALRVEPLQQMLGELGLAPERLILELTEHEPIADVSALREALAPLRAMGMSMAMDDVGSGYASMQALCELEPDYVKLDKYFVACLQESAIKRRFIRGLVLMAKAIGAQVVAEGVEGGGEIPILMDLGVEILQGYYFARPGLPPHCPTLAADFWQQHQPALVLGRVRGVASDILRRAPCVAHDTPVRELHVLLLRQKSLPVVAVCRGDQPLGLILRAEFMERISRPYVMDIFGRHPAVEFVSEHTLMVDEQESLAQISKAFTASAQQSSVMDHFIITHQGRYVGVGRIVDLLERITAVHLEMARYANPLTGLPGNVAIQQRTEALLDEGTPFTLAYIDLDNFKAFNDRYGYARGDLLLRAVAEILSLRVGVDRERLPDLQAPFVGHVGGDDFVVILPDLGHEALMQDILTDFSRRTPDFYDAEDRWQGGIQSHDRQGNTAFFPLASLSIAVVPCPMGAFPSAQAIAEVAAELKGQAKKMPGNSVFVDRRGTDRHRVGSGE